MKHARAPGITVAVVVFALDQLVKWVVAGPLHLKMLGQIEFFPIFNLTWVENYGVSLGLLTAGSATGRWLLTGLTALIATVVAIWLWREKNRHDVTGLGLVLGGALGNILDFDAGLLEMAAVENHFVGAAAVAAGIQHRVMLLQAGLDVVGVEDGQLGSAAQAVAPHH